MERDFSGARLSPESFRRLADECLGDGRFPARYDDWEALVREGTQQARADGRPTEEIPIDVDEFLAWCRKVAIHPCFDALRAYLILARGGADALPGQKRSDQQGRQRESAARDSSKDQAKRVAAMVTATRLRLRHAVARVTRRLRTYPATA